METLRNVSPYYEPMRHFDAKFVNGKGHEMSNVQKWTGHGHFLEMKISAYHCPYDPVENKVNAIYIVYKIRKYDVLVQSTITYSPVEWTIIIVVYASERINGTCLCSVHKSSLWVNHEKIRDFACRLPLKASTLNLFYRVVHFDDASDIDSIFHLVSLLLE